MRVACVGNMNNMMFTLCRYLRDSDVDAHLFTFSDEAEHFLPVADTYTEDYKGFTINLPIGREHLTDNSKISLVKKAFSGYDFFIGTDFAPALLALIGLKLDVFIPHGSDIYGYPFPSYRDTSTSKVWWLKSVYYLGKMQKIGIENAVRIFFPDEYEKNNPYKQRLRCEGTFFNTSGPMLYIPQYQAPDLGEHFKKLEHYNLFLEIRRSYELVVFSHARQNGINLPEEIAVHDKGNANLIEGFAKFVRASSVNACLVLFEYGMDVESSKKMVAELGIAERVKWMPKMQRKEIMFGIRNADVVCGEFKNSWLTCGVVNETLAMGKPLLHFRNDNLYQHDYPELYPLLNAQTADEICMQLDRYIHQRQTIEEQALEGIKWLETYSVKRPVDLICSFIDLGQSANRFSLKERLLMRILIVRLKAAINTRRFIERIFG